MEMKPQLPSRQKLINLREIDESEIEEKEIVGRGSYGTVYKAKWRNRYVAVKEFDSMADKRSVEVEVKQLSRVEHPNIISLYGISSTKTRISLIMEYAEGGSLYNLLHGKFQPVYTAAHAMSWAHQCAEGVAYMHAMKPKPLIHRDLKPPNLLLFNEGRQLKICDFGTATEKATNLTNNKGSAAWMAPEVFATSNYTEKCDVFSWGIILWEVLTREVPFKNMPHTLSIMWNIHKGGRPTKIIGCPKPIEDLMTTCWDPSPEKRPSMSEVVCGTQILCKFLPGDDVPIDLNSGKLSDDSDENYSTIAPEHFYENVPHTFRAPPDQELITIDHKRSNSDGATGANCIFDNLIGMQIQSPLIANTTWCSTIPEEGESKYNTESKDPNYFPEIDYLPTKRTEEEQQQRNESIRNGMIKLQGTKMPLLSINIDENTWELKEKHIHSIVHHIGSKSDGKENLRITDTKSVGTSDEEDEIEDQTTMTNTQTANETATVDDDNFYLMLDPELQPATPVSGNRESQQIFEEHKSLAKEYLKVDEELYYAQNQKEKILAAMDPEEQAKKMQILQKIVEKQELLELFNDLKRQLAEAKRMQDILELNDSQEPFDIQQPNHSQYQSSQSEASDSNDEWVFIPGDKS